MRLRTKLFLTWACIILVLWAGAFWSINRVITLRINQMAQDAFAGTQSGLEGMQKERFARMQQAGHLFVSIPDLRALIAESNVELTATNRVSLQNRLDDLEKLVDVSFVSVLDRDGREIAHSSQSPWAGAEEWNRFTAGSQQSLTLLRRVFGESTDAAGDAESGLWPWNGKLYQIVVCPLRFGKGAESETMGAVVFGEQISDEAATALGRSHNSLITFFTGDAVGASSLPPAAQTQIAAAFRQNRWPVSRPFMFEFAGTLYHGSIQPVLDPPSGTIVGHMLIQCDQQDAAVRASIMRSLVAIMVSGLVLAAVISFITSSTITRPVQRLVDGVHRVAQGNLNLTLPAVGHDELGELSRAFNDMVSQIRSRRELELQYEAAQSASRAKSQFLANMSHEIRTPLNGVIGMTELLIGTPLTEQQRRYAAMAKTSAELLTTQINDILDLSKIEAGKLEIEAIDFNLHETVEAVVELLSDKASKKKLELACHFQPDVPRHVRGDPDRLRQILVNLINNAIKFTHAGSIVVRLALQADTAGKSIVRFSVIDSGIGIPTERLDRLFKPFSQVDASTTRKYGGTGLGLAISKQLAELMGGSIGVESEADRGSTFWFTIAMEKSAGEAAKDSGNAFDPESIRVLAVDDSQTTCAILQEQLASWGVDADTVCNAANAIGAMKQALAARRPYQVVIIDSDMPATSGFELARLIKADPQLNKTVLMALLPIESPLSDPQLRDAGFAAHMTKPARQSRLFDELMRAMAREHALNLRTDAAASTAERQGQDAKGVGGRILVAEDNEVNQIVVLELLTKAGHQCKVVDDGRKAVEAAVSGEWDLVLMDCQMPEMDGFEAARLIRQKEATGGVKRRIPIIALTANAIKGDREQCLEAGMDSYCSKPVDARQLLAQIESYLKQKSPGAGASQAAPAIASPAPSEDPSISPAIVIDTLLSRCMNNLSTIEVVMQKFEQQTQRDTQQIQQSLAASDLVAATRTAHSLKGAAGIVAAERLAGIAGEIERLGREQDAEQMQQSLGRLREEVDRCIAYLPHVRAITKQRLASSNASSAEVKPCAY